MSLSIDRTRLHSGSRSKRTTHTALILVCDVTSINRRLALDINHGKIVVEASGSAKVLEDAINYVRRGGKLVCYGVYPSAARVSWAPSKIFGDGKRET